MQKFLSSLEFRCKSIYKATDWFIKEKTISFDQLRFMIMLILNITDKIHLDHDGLPYYPIEFDINTNCKECIWGLDFKLPKNSYAGSHLWIKIRYIKDKFYEISIRTDDTISLVNNLSLKDLDRFFKNTRKLNNTQTISHITS